MGSLAFRKGGELRDRLTSKRTQEMEKKETISKTDWDKTPKTVKKLVKQLVGTLNVVVIPE